jgi:hypothetical protein
MNAHNTIRPEGPAENSPGREAGVKDNAKLSTEGAALRYPSVPRLQRSFFWQPYPGLTAGPILCRPFGPRKFDHTPIPAYSDLCRYAHTNFVFPNGYERQ